MPEKFSVFKSNLSLKRYIYIYIGYNGQLKIDKIIQSPSFLFKEILLPPKVIFYILYILLKYTYW